MRNQVIEPTEIISQTVLNARDGNLTVDVPDMLFNAEFLRDGPDLVLTNEGHPDIRVVDYFRVGKAQDISSSEGATLTGDVIELLAGPAFAGQTAQSTQVASGDPIGQVETLEGTAFVQRADGTTEQLNLGTKVFSNDVVRTAEGGNISITFADGTIFTLASSSRMVLNEFIYDPNGSANSGVFNLVEGTFVFIAGQVAKTGGMEVKTPSATMGIRGTTVKVDIITVEGKTTVEVTLNRDPDGELGQFEITRLDGTLIANVETTDTKWIISPVEGETREVPRTIEDLSSDQLAITQAVTAFREANQRVDDGGEYVERDSGDGSQPDGKEPKNEDPKDDEKPDQRGDLGSSGIETELAADSGAGGQRPGVQITELGDTGLPEGDRPPAGPGGPEGDGGAPEEGGAGITTSQPTNQSPEIILTGGSFTVVEDGSVTLTGFGISDPNGTILTATLVAGSTVTLSPGSGVSIIEGTGTNDERVVIQGTGAQITDALNGIEYSPSPNADDTGTLDITVSDGEFTASTTVTIDIVPVQDEPVANTDTAAVGASDAAVTGSLVTNDDDPDVSPTPDVLSVIFIQQGSSAANVPPGGSGTITLSGGGTLTVNSDGTFNFDPAGGYTSLGAGATLTETVNYTVTDGNPLAGTTLLQTSTSTLNVTVTGSNVAPTVTGTGSITINENDVIDFASAATSIDVTDPDTAATSIVFTLTAPPTLGEFGLNGDFITGAPIVSFTLDQLRSGALEYRHLQRVGGTESLNYTVTDGASTVSGSFDINVNNVNDVPTATGLPLTANAVEDAPTDLDLSAIDISDLDAGSSPIFVRLTPTSGTLTAASTGVVTVSTSTTLGATTTTLIGSVADLNTYLNTPSNIQYLGSLNNEGTGADTITVVGNDDDGGSGDITLGTVQMNISAVNDPPTATNLPSTITGDEDDTFDFDISAINISDIDAGTGTFTLKLTPGTGSLSATASAGIGINTVGSTLELSGTVGDLNTYLNTSSNVQYTGATDVNGTDTVTIVVNDGGNTGTGGGTDITVGTVNVNLTAINDAPVVQTASGFDLNYTENDAATVVNNTIVITDVDGGVNNATNITTASVRISQNYVQGEDLLQFTDYGPFTHNFNATTGLLVIFGDASPADFQAAIRTVTYVNTSDNPSELERTIEFRATDGITGGDSLIVTSKISPTTQNDDPTQVNLPTTLAATEDMPADFDLSSLVLTDVDAGTSDVSVKLTTTNGDFIATSAVGVAVAKTGTGPITLELTGSIAEITDYLSVASRIQYVPGTDFSGADTVSVIINDGGNTGTGGGTDVNLGSITVNVAGENDDPSAINLPASVTAVEDVASDFDISAVTLVDPDAATGTVTLKLTPNMGTLTATADPNVTITTTGTGPITTEISGTLANINAYLDVASNIKYKGPTDTNGPGAASVTVFLNDNGNSGTGGDTDVSLGTVAVDIAAVNDAPTGVLPANASANEEQTFGPNLSAFSISDIDAGTGNVQLTLTASNVLLSFPSSPANVAVASLGGGVYTLTGSVSAINDYVQGPSPAILFTGEANFDGTATVQFAVNDLGNTGTGGNLSTNIGTMDVTINPVNDAPEIAPLSPDLDLFLANTGNNSQQVLLNTTGTNYTQSSAFNGNFSDGGDVADIDGDGDLDVVVAGFFNAVSSSFLATNDGSGNFSVSALDTGGAGRDAAVFVDLDQSGQLDMVLTGSQGTIVTVAENGTRTSTSFSLGGRGYDLAAADVNGDGLEDVVVALGSSSPNRVYLNNGDGTLTDSGVSLGNRDSRSVKAGDLDGDGNIDLVFGTYSGGTSEVYLNLGNGAFSNTASSTFGGSDTVDIDMGDVDGDGDLDIVATSFITDDVTVYANNGSGNFTQLGTSLSMTDAAIISLADFDGDGDLDAVVSTFDNSANDRILLNDGSGNFTFATNSLSTFQVREILVGDFDGDSQSKIQVTEDVATGIANISFSDVDAGTTPVTVTLSTVRGTLTVSDSVSGGLTATGITQTNANTVVLNGTIAQINATLADANGAAYTTDLNDTKDDTLTITINDNGSGTGSGNALTDTITRTIKVTAVDDGPAAATDLGAVADGSAVALSGTQFMGDANERAGESVNSIGDINNDGIDDFAITAIGNGSPVINGSTWVIYGTVGNNPYGADVELDLVGSTIAGFEIVGGASDDQFGTHVSGIGDINNDGIDDFSIGAPFDDTGATATMSSPVNPGSVTVVYGGQTFGSHLSANNVGTSLASSIDGFQLHNTINNGNLGQGISSAGDLNFDGIDDLAVGTPTSTTGPGGAWVVFGGQAFDTTKNTNGDIFLDNDLPAPLDGFEFVGESTPDLTGYSLSFIGDWNNDGIDDLAIGSLQNNGGGIGSSAGAIHVVYGGQDFAAIAASLTGTTGNDYQILLDTVGAAAGPQTAGFQLNGVASGDAAGYVVNGAGDVNNDGIADMIVTAQAADSGQGAAYVIYGGQTITGVANSLGSVGTTISGFKLEGSAAGNRVSYVDTAGDVNGDGIADLIVGSHLADIGGGTNQGETYVIYGGQNFSATMSLGDVGGTIEGFRLTGEGGGNQSGLVVSAAGDVNNDGFDDLLVGAEANFDNGVSSGSGYLVFGGDFTGSTTQLGTSANESLSGTSGVDRMFGGEGADTLVGNGGADVLDGGRGDDVLSVGDTNFTKIDGGAGQDTLLLDFAGTIDLQTISNERIEGIEKISIADGNVNDLTVHIDDVFAMTDNGNSSLEGFLSSPNLPNSLLIDADTGDSITLHGGITGNWDINLTASTLAPGYNVYEFTKTGSMEVLATVGVDDDVVPNLLPTS